MKRGSIDDNWAWSNQHMEEFKKTAEFTKMKKAVADVKAAFAAQNAGYTLGVDPDKVRSLETQIKLWNQNHTVHKLGRELKTKLLKALETLPDTPDEASLKAFKKVLVEARLSGTPSNATPGLSQHGQAKAFDFVVSKGRDVVAGTVTATIQEKWENAGWTAKLKKAVQDAGGKFVGPLPRPRALALHLQGVAPTVTLVAKSHQRPIGRSLGKMGAIVKGKTRQQTNSPPVSTVVSPAAIPMRRGAVGQRGT